MIAGLALDRWCGPLARRYLKRHAARAMRRAGRRDIDAPTRRGFAGWWS